MAELETFRRRFETRLAELDTERSLLTRDIRRINDTLEVLAGRSGDEEAAASSRIVDHSGKYRALWQELTRRDGSTWKASFSEIENFLGFRLPPSSRKHLPHWYGYEGSAVARAIHDAGWRATNVNLDNETVVFRRRNT